MFLFLARKLEVMVGLGTDGDHQGSSGADGPTISTRRMGVVQNAKLISFTAIPRFIFTPRRAVYGPMVAGLSAVVVCSPPK